MSKEFSIWSSMKNLSYEKIKEYDHLKFLEKSEFYIENYVFKKNKSKSEINNMNFLTGLWGSGKTSFINFVLWQLKNNKNYLGKKKLLPIFFNPRNFQISNNIYEIFMEIFVSGLLNEKFDKNIKKDAKELVKILEKGGNSFINLVYNLFYQNSNSLEKKLENINRAIETTYKEYMIIVVIDEIDRVGKEDLINIGKILNILKWLGIKNKSSNFISIYSVDSRHLQSFSFSDSNIKNPINFYQYYKKFSDSKYDIYENSRSNIIEFLFYSIKNLENYFKDNSFDEDRNRNLEDLKNITYKIQNILERVGIVFSIRDIEQFSNDMEKLIYNIQLSISKKITYISKYHIYRYLFKKINSDFICNILFFKNLIEKYPFIFEELDNLSNKINLQYGAKQTDSIEEIRIYLKKLLDSENISFEYLIENEPYKVLSYDKVFLEFIKNDYFFIKQLVSPNDPDVWIKYIENEYENDKANEIKSGSFKINYKNSKYLFSHTFYNNWYESYRSTHLSHIYDLIIKRGFNESQSERFLDIVIESAKLILKSKSENWKLVDEIFQSLIMFVSNLYDHCKLQYNIELANKILDKFLESIEKNFEENLFEKVYLYMLLFSESKDQRNNNNDTFCDYKPEIDTTNLEILQDLKLSQKDQQWENIRGSKYLGTKLLEYIDNLLKSQKYEFLDEYVDEMINNYGTEDMDIPFNKLIILSRLIYNLFEFGLFEWNENKMIYFVNKCISPKYKFLLLCRRGIHYDYHGFNNEFYYLNHGERGEYKIFLKKIYENLKNEIGENFLEEMINKYESDIRIEFLHDHTLSHHSIDFILKHMEISKEQIKVKIINILKTLENYK